MPASLPTELWKTIFRYATYAGIDPSAAIPHVKPYTAWFSEFENDNLGQMKTKLALTQLSHRFRRIALEPLYEFVIIDATSKAYQAEKLVEMMKAQSSSSEVRPREWIRFLCVRRSSAQLVTEILRLCCNLKGFSWNPYYTDIKPPDWEAAQDEMIRTIPTNLRFLHWNGSIQFNTLSEFLQKASSSLQILCACRIRVNKLPQQPFLRASYPSLTHVHLEGTSLFVWLEAVNWEMPSLTELNLFELFADEGLPKVFRSVGTSLRVLRLGCYVRLIPELLSYILDAYENLEEIYYHTGYGIIDDTPGWASGVTHMKMKQVGINASMARSMTSTFDKASSMLRDTFGPISRTRFPSLDTLIISDIYCGSRVPTLFSFVMRRVSEDFRSAEISRM